MRLRSLWFEYAAAHAKWKEHHMPSKRGKVDREYRDEVRKARKRWKSAVKEAGLKYTNIAVPQHKFGQWNTFQYTSIPLKDHKGYILSDGQVFNLDEPL